MIGNPEKVHKMKAEEDERDIDAGWDITVKDVETLIQLLTPTIHTLTKLKPVVQPYMPLGSVHDMKKIIREEEQDYDVPLHDGQLNKFGKECSNITRVAKKANGNPVKDVQELLDIKTYDCETFIRKLLHQ
ncbi:hypothetical protein Tco_0997894, partial [Tanacetum coccineum]